MYPTTMEGISCAAIVSLIRLSSRASVLWAFKTIELSNKIMVTIRFMISLFL